MNSWTKLLKTIVVTAIAACGLILPAAANAATVVNGNFETGTLTGWQLYNSTSNGSWYVLNAAEVATFNAEEEFNALFPPTGTFGAYTYEGSPDTAILYQDVALEPYYTHQLSLSLGYNSAAPIVAPPTLAVEEPFENQQLRVDVMKPTAPIESVNPSDILATVFANHTGDPTSMSPRTITADLTPFSGQTVRIRIANAVNDNEFNTSLDNVAITSTPPNNAITPGKVVLNKKKGTGKLAINVPGAGSLIEMTNGSPKRIKPVTLNPTAAGTVQIPLNPTGAGRKALEKKGKLKAQVQVTFTPTGGLTNTQIYKVTLKNTLKKHH